MADIRHGHPEFYRICEYMAELHNKKNQDYAFGGRPLGNFERVAKIMELYPHIQWDTPEMVAVVYMLKQFDAYMWLCNSGHISVTGEGKRERLLDISIYSGIIQCREKDKLDEYASVPIETPSTEHVPLRVDESRVESISTTRGERFIKRDLAAASRAVDRPGSKRPPKTRSSAASKSR